MSGFIWSVTYRRDHSRENAFNKLINVSIGNDTHQAQSLTFNQIVKTFTEFCKDHRSRIRNLAQKEQAQGSSMLKRLTVIHMSIQHELMRRFPTSINWPFSKDLRNLFTEYINVTHAVILSKRHYETRKVARRPVIPSSVHNPSDREVFALVEELRGCLAPAETIDAMSKISAKWKADTFLLTKRKHRIIFDIHRLVKRLVNWTTTDFIEFQKKPRLSTLLQHLEIRHSISVELPSLELFYAKRYVSKFVDMSEGWYKIINQTQLLHISTILKFEELRFWAPSKSKTSLTRGIRGIAETHCQADWLKELKLMRKTSLHDDCKLEI